MNLYNTKKIDVLETQLFAFLIVRGVGVTILHIIYIQNVEIIKSHQKHVSSTFLVRKYIQSRDSFSVERL